MRYSKGNEFLLAKISATGFSTRLSPTPRHCARRHMALGQRFSSRRAVTITAVSSRQPLTPSSRRSRSCTACAPLPPPFARSGKMQLWRDSGKLPYNASPSEAWLRNPFYRMGTSRKIAARTRTHTPSTKRDCTMCKDACCSTGRPRLCCRSPADRTKMVRPASYGASASLQL